MKFQVRFSDSDEENRWLRSHVAELENQLTFVSEENTRLKNDRYAWAANRAALETEIARLNLEPQNRVTKPFAMRPEPSLFHLKNNRLVSFIDPRIEQFKLQQ